MRTRFRLAAALFALLALSASLVEQAWAVACMGMERPAATAERAAPAHGSHGGDLPGSSDPAPDEPRSPDAPPCPMAAAGGVACGVAATPAATASVPTATESHLLVVPAADEVPVSLALSSLFRPPRR